MFELNPKFQWRSFWWVIGILAFIGMSISAPKIEAQANLVSECIRIFGPSNEAYPLQQGDSLIVDYTDNVGYTDLIVPGYSVEGVELTPLQRVFAYDNSLSTADIRLRYEPLSANTALSGTGVIVRGDGATEVSFAPNTCVGNAELVLHTNYPRFYVEIENGQSVPEFVIKFIRNDGTTMDSTPDVFNMSSLSMTPTPFTTYRVTADTSAIAQSFELMDLEGKFYYSFNLPAITATIVPEEAISDNAGNVLVPVKIQCTDFQENVIKWLGKFYFTVEITNGEFAPNPLCLDGTPLSDFDWFINPSAINSNSISFMAESESVDENQSNIPVDMLFNWKIIHLEETPRLLFYLRLKNPSEPVSFNGSLSFTNNYPEVLTEDEGILYPLAICVPPNPDIVTFQSSISLTSNELRPCYPNPFNPSTTIAFTLAQPEHVKLNIYNTAGQLIRTLVDESRSAGVHEVMWDGKNGEGLEVSSGIYLYRLETARNTTNYRRMVLLR